VRKRLRAPAAVFVYTEPGSTAVVASEGVEETDRFVGLAERSHRAAVVPLAGGCWLVAPLRRGDERLAVVFARCARHDHDRALRALTQLAAEAAVGIQNAVLFQRIREMSVDEERQRIARDLHDSVAQSLAHLRLELDFIAQTSEDMNTRDGLARMSRVAERVAVDVRSAIRGLRGGLREGLSGALRGYVSDLRRDGSPAIRLDADDSVRLPPAVEHETFRIAQEAVSNAVRHARASEVHVGLERHTGAVRLVVEDDGRGIGADAMAGVGLEAMHERAERIGARLSIERASRGGTRISLDVPLRIRSRQ
ncbi:MAG: sensor histidine kinase, partial [Actinomycetota bacterium]